MLAIDRTYCCSPVPSYFPARVSLCACRVTEAGCWLSVFEAMSSPAEAAIRWADIVEDDLKTDIEPLNTEAGSSPAMELSLQIVTHRESRMSPRTQEVPGHHPVLSLP